LPTDSSVLVANQSNNSGNITNRYCLPPDDTTQSVICYPPGICPGPADEPIPCPEPGDVPESNPCLVDPENTTTICIPNTCEDDPTAMCPQLPSVLSNKITNSSVLGVIS
jgi:hypothetical protein